MVFDLIQREDVHAIDLCRRNQEILLGPAFTLRLARLFGKLFHILLAVAVLEQIDKFCERLRVIRSGSAAGNNMPEVSAFLCKHRDTAEIQHI